jgi:hypothetical protein
LSYYIGIGTDINPSLAALPPGASGNYFLKWLKNGGAAFGRLRLRLRLRFVAAPL